MPNVLYVLPRLELYHPARLHALQSLLRIRSIGNLLVVELTDRQWQHPVSAAGARDGLSAVTMEEGSSGRTVDFPAFEAVAAFSPDVVVTTGYWPSKMRRWATWARRCKLPSVLICPSQRRDKRRWWPIEYVKGHFSRRHFVAAFVGGSRAAAYLGELGFPEDRVWRGYDVVDNEMYRSTSLSQRAGGLDLPDKYFLFVGRLAREKNVRVILRAFRRFVSDNPFDNWKLVVVGTGPEERRLKELADDLGLKGRVLWLGYLQPSSLPLVYEHAAALVLPSLSEPWGLVVNEAMAAGLPVLVSTQCGVAPELVRPGVNGWIFRPNDVERLAGYLETLASNPSLRRRMGRIGCSLVDAYTPVTWADALVDCLTFAVSRARP